MSEKLSTGLVNAINTVGSVKSIMTNFVIGVYSGTQPADADTTEGTAVLLGLITVDGGDFTPGSPTNGLNFDVSTDGYLYKDTSETWRMAGLPAAGTGTQATWFRAYSNAMVTGDSTTAIRFDGAIGTSTAYEGQMTNTTIVENGPSLINSFYFCTKKA